MATAFMLFASQVLAFDTGHHTDLTRNALLREGFNSTATDVVILQNWITDYYGNFPTVVAVANRKVYAELKFNKKHLEKLHFDNLFNSQEIRAYWWRLVLNTQSALRGELVKENPDALAVLSILGISLHAVQDFYSHSNWAEIYGSSTGPFETKTWFDVESSGGVPLPLKLQTGWYENEMFPSQPLGTLKHDQLNKDHYKRPNWIQAYVFAYAATRQWVHEFEKWVEVIRPGFWRDVKGFTLCGDDADYLSRDLKLAYGIQTWIPDPIPSGGHWKGPGSWRTGRFLRALDQWRRSPASTFKKEFTERRRFVPLAEGLYKPLPNVTLPTIRPYPLNEMAVILRTTGTFNNDPFIDYPTDPGSTEVDSPADMLARITLGTDGPGGFTQEFVEATQQDDNGSANWPWYTIRFVPADTPMVTVGYSLFDEDTLEDTPMDIMGAVGKWVLDFNFLTGSNNCSGDITGIHDTEATAVTTEGEGVDKRPARVRFYITKRALR